MQSAPIEEPIPLSRALLRQFRAEIRRTGVTALMLMRGTPDHPAELNARVINRWLGGIIKQAPQAHIDYVLAAFAALPDRGGGTSHPRQTRWPRTAEERWIPLTADMRTEISILIERTGFSVASLLDGAADLPEGLKPRIVRGWIHGEVKSVDAAHWTYVIARLSNPPKDMQPTTVPLRRRRTKIARNLPFHRPITDFERAALRAHRTRTGITGTRLLDSVADKPKGLSAAVITGWLTGKTKTANPAMIAYVLERYAAIRDQAAKR